MKKIPFSFCLITDFRFIGEQDIERVIGDAIRGGIDLVQFRDTGSPPEVQLERAKRVSRVTGKKARLMINSDYDLMRLLDADGVQVKSSDLSSIPFIRKQIGPEKYIGGSVHNEKEIFVAERLKADFLILSPLFSPGSKSGELPFLGTQNFRKLCSLTSLPVLALGGLDESNIEDALSAGAQGVSMVTGLLARGGDIYMKAKKIRQSLTRGVCKLQKHHKKSAGLL